MIFRNGGIRALIIWYAIILHLLQGSLMVASDSAGWVTSTSHIRSWFGMSAEVLGGLYIGIALLALLGLVAFKRLSLPRLLTVVPQQVFLTFAAAGAGVSIMDSAFADGVLRSRFFIAADQSPIIIAAFLHSLAVIDGRLGVLWNSLRSR